MLIKAIKHLMSTEDGELSEQKNRELVHAGNNIMLTSVIIILIGTVIGYTHDQYFQSLWIQVPSHMALIVFAGVLKVGYVIRCLGRYGLGFKEI